MSDRQADDDPRLGHRTEECRAGSQSPTSQMPRRVHLRGCRRRVIRRVLARPCGCCCLFLLLVNFSTRLGHLKTAPSHARSSRCRHRILVEPVNCVVATRTKVNNLVCYPYTGNKIKKDKRNNYLNKTQFCNRTRHSRRNKNPIYKNIRNYSLKSKFTFASKHGDFCI